METQTTAPETLAAEILERSFALLTRALKLRHDDFHTATLGTTGLDGEPELRTVVLRKFSPETRNLVCHVDLRSPKIKEIEKDNRVSWLFYHHEEKLQLRIKGAATIHTTDELADAQWQSSALFSRRCYCGEAPGTAKEAPSSGLPEFLEDRQPTEAETENLGRKNFAVLETNIGEIEIYELHVRGHRRSLFVFNENGKHETRWLTP